MNESDSMLIRECKDAETALALKRICRYLVDIGWHHDGDDDEWGAELRLAVARSKRHKEAIKILSELDIDLAWGQTKRHTGEKTYIITGGGDFNPWYDGDLALQELLNSLSDLVDILESSTPTGIIEAEFLHFYRYLQYVLIPARSLKKAPVRSITFDGLHPKIRQHCLSRYKSKNYSDTILTAYKVVFNEIKDITTIKNLDGKPLAEKSFALDNPIIKLNDLVTESEKDEQKGFMLLLAGAALGIRNPKAHDLIDQEDEYRTLEYLSFASLLLTRIDERKALDLTSLTKTSVQPFPPKGHQRQPEELPYVYIQGRFSGNGQMMDFRTCTTYNLSDQFVVIEKMKILAATIPFGNTIIESGKSLQHTGIDGLSYPVSDDPKQTVKIYFHSRNKQQFVSTQKLKFQERTDGKFNIIDIDEATISKIKTGAKNV